MKQFFLQRFLFLLSAPVCSITGNPLNFGEHVRWLQVMKRTNQEVPSELYDMAPCPPQLVRFLDARGVERSMLSRDTFFVWSAVSVNETVKR